jgi:hypothetical protein
VAAASICAAPTTVNLSLGVATTVTGTLDAARNVCVNGAVPDGTLDVTATSTDTTPHDFFMCVQGIPDVNTGAATGIGRSSHVTGNPVQRVAFDHLKYAAYLVQVQSSGAVIQQGCLNLNQVGGGSKGPFTMTLKYVSQPRLPAGNGFAFDTKHLPPSQPSPSTPGGGEPSIAVDRLHGDRVYISTPVGVPSGANCVINLTLQGCQGTNFWFSLDAGKTFTFCNTSFRNGGGDSTLAVDTTGSIYTGDLAATDVPTGKLASTGPNSPPTPVANPDGSCNIPDTPPTGAAADRQWEATYLPDPSQGTGAAKVVMSYNSAATSEPLECLGLAGAQAWSPVCAPIITNPAIAADGLNNAVNGNQVFDSKGNVYSVFSTSTAGEIVPAGGSPPSHNVYVGRSADGISFTDLPVYLPQPATDVNIYRLFPVIAVDRADNLYVVWPETNIASGRTVVKMASSTDHGDHWSAAHVVNTPDLGSNVLPWIVGGDDGKVDIAWIGSDATDLRQTTHDFYVFMAQSLNAHAANPVFTEARVSPQPVRYAALCFKGTLCLTDGDDGRILLDFMTLDLDSHGMANITYANAGPDTNGFTVTSPVQPFTDFAKQTAGPSICSGACTSIPIPANPGSLPNTRLSAEDVVPVAVSLLASVMLGLLSGLLARRRKRPA